jgi:hypothetical protein
MLGGGTSRIMITQTISKSSSLRNVVVRDIRDRDGCKLGRLIEPHDGTEGGVIAAAQRISDKMFTEYSDASNIESRICATDASGKLRWVVSPNFEHLAEVGTDEADYIWGLIDRVSLDANR